MGNEMVMMMPKLSGDGIDKENVGQFGSEGRLTTLFLTIPFSAWQFTCCLHGFKMLKW